MIQQDLRGKSLAMTALNEVFNCRQIELHAQDSHFAHKTKLKS